MSVTRRELARALREELGGTITSHDEWLQTLMAIMSEKIIEEGRVELRGFGAFQLRKISAQTTIKPTTGRKMKVPESYTVDFKVAKAFKESIKKANKPPEKPKSKTKKKSTKSKKGATKKKSSKAGSKKSTRKKAKKK